MKKLILLFSIILFVQSAVCGEVLLPRGKQITRETNPIYWGYMEDYAKELKKAMESKRFFRLRGWGSSYEYIITRDGEIKDMSLSISENKYYDKKVKEIISSVKPLPFREGMELEKLYCDVFLGFYRDSKFSLNIYTIDKELLFITIYSKK